ncbi:hypothetical protein AQI88_36395 [Streptomyces cellostaticus]|uniref:Uncharacterized protein n=1 Tax=Streptomyces cellostaticus TaxID=67285 RepID=A0A101NEJ9_9ACTN|nr:hypothetical protein [Streptomyces cellostaticus]KUM91576.1 hypothetical protein AQI88_36395 [Streptomyces cellostaticus]GHI06282.1 hypothetical protein Scel_46030 [Streptomyces cellostaticus]
MAQAAPAPGGLPRSTPKAVTRGAAPDVFDARTHRIARLAGPVLLGLVYGYWAAANRRSGGPITGWNLLFGFVTAIVFAVVLMALLTLAPRMRRELHALAWTAFIGCAFGFLYSQTGESVLRSIGMSLAVSAVTFAVFFYRFYTHEDAAGHRVR